MTELEFDIEVFNDVDFSKLLFSEQKNLVNIFFNISDNSGEPFWIRADGRLPDFVLIVLNIFIQQKSFWQEYICSFTKSSDIILFLANNENSRVRSLVALNRNVMAPVIEFLSEDENPVVRAAVSFNQNVSEKIISKLAYDSSTLVAMCAISKTKSSEVLEEFKGHQISEVKMMVATNHLTPIKDVVKLADGFKLDLNKLLFKRKSDVVSFIIEQQGNNSFSIETISSFPLSWLIPIVIGFVVE